MTSSPGNRLINKKKLDNFRVITEEEDIYNERAEFVTNPPPLSADRFLNQAAFKINSPNYF